MCRLFGFRSNVPSAVHRQLIAEKNSLRAQSIEHKDGWGLAAYDTTGLSKIVHGLGPAHLDPRFEGTIGNLSVTTMVAHVRLASIGSIQMTNAHPFTLGEWTFVHNGTLSNYADCQAEIERQISTNYRAFIRGGTDSERCFYHFLTQLALRTHSGATTLQQVSDALNQSVSMISQITDRPSGPPSSMNFLVTDGKLMVATRRGRTLFINQTQLPIRSVSISSEQVSGSQEWVEIPEDSLVSIDAQLSVRHSPLRLQPPIGEHP